MVLVFSAHAADCVWRAGRAIAFYATFSFEVTCTSIRVGSDP
jgi:hypothetical protein